jgi:hypothetical protein
MEEVQREDIGTESYVAKWKSWEGTKERLLAGATLSDVCRWLKEHEPEAKARSDNALMKALSRLRTELKKTEAQSKLAELKRKADEAAVKEPGSPEQVDTYVDVLESLASLYLLQMDRIKMGRSIEEKVKYLIARMTQDIGEAREILKFMFEVQQELGLAKRRPLELTGRFAVLSFEQRQRVGKVLDLVKQKVLAKQAEEALVTKAADETVRQAVDGDVIDVLPTQQQASQQTGQVIPFVDKFAPEPDDPVLSDLPFELDDEEPREE